MNTPKPLGGRAYGSIPHLHGSRLGPGDHHVHEGQERIATERVRDRNDVVIVQEKLDGSCCAVANIDGHTVALTRAGYLATTSPFEQHHLFAAWVVDNAALFEFLSRGERVAGEWMAQAHGTRYVLPHGPFVAFDLMRGKARATFDEFRTRAVHLPQPWVISDREPRSVEWVQEHLAASHHGALDPVEGAVWRVERRGVVDFLCKWVRADKADGCYLPEVSGEPPVWNWQPEQVPA